MSGPKVVRIVTREEILAICERQLRQLHAAHSEWIAVAKQTKAEEQFITKTIHRRERLDSLLSTDRFVEFQKEVGSEVSFLQADSEQRLRDAAQAQALAKARERRSLQAAADILVALTNADVEIPADIQQILTARKSGEALDIAIRQALKLLPASENTSVSDRQRQLAAALGQDQQRLTLDEWLKAAGNLTEPSKAPLIEERIAELEQRGVDCSTFVARLRALSAEPLDRRDLLADSLLIELSQILNTEKKANSLRIALKQHAEELTRIGTDEAKRVASSITTELSNGRIGPHVAKLVELADGIIASHVKTIAVAAGRQQILRGLSALGYQVNEGMATAWVQKGRLVVRRAASADYGVEIVGGAQVERLQIKAVAIARADQVHDPARDRDIETMWCSDFQALQEFVAREGGNIELQKALPIGHAPLSVVESYEKTTHEAIEPKLQQEFRRIDR